MYDYLQELNDVQRAAVTTTEGPVLVVAGPGSGKTRVLTYRIAHLINIGTEPWKVLALTFTNKAAREMKERISSVVGGRANELWAGTFHSVFCKILRIEADKIGYPRSFSIYDTQDSNSLLSNIIQEMGLDAKAYRVNSVRSRISAAKSNLLTPAAYLQNPTWMTEDHQHRIPDLAYIYQRYVARCKKAGAMDFDDLLFQLYQLFKRNPDQVLEKYQRRFKYVLVDEFQDTNSLQYALLKLFVQYGGSPNNICAVGDDAQSIYAFRGATIQNILDFEQDFPQLQTFKLEQNYRSTEHIVQAANEVITKNQRQIPKTIWSSKGAGRKIQIVGAQNDTEEGRRVAGLIVEQKSRYHLKNSDIAILYRTNAQSRIFEDSLRRQNILYRVFGGLSFYQRKEVKDLIAYLRLTVNTNDEEALRRIINFPKRGIGKTTVDKVGAAANDLGKSMWEAIDLVNVNSGTKKKLEDFKKLIRHFQSLLEAKNAYEVAVYVSEKSGILDLLKEERTEESRGRIENVVSLLDGIGSFVKGDSIPNDAVVDPDDKSLAAYLQSISLLTDQDTDDEESKNVVALMSVHAAKGLEFKSVFVVGLEEKLFPSYRDEDRQREPEKIDEERRLFYVAITRSEQYLTLSFAKDRYQYGEFKKKDPSRFITEISRKHFETINALGPTSSPQSMRTGVQGNFKKPVSRARPLPNIKVKNFKPSPASDIQVGMKVIHQRFGEGKVLSIDGQEGAKVATIFFNLVPKNPERKIMLKFSKLQIVG